MCVCCVVCVCVCVCVCSAIFSEVMEMVEPWYNSTGLEADQVKARKQASRLNMTRDPRTSRPFDEEMESSGPVWNPDQSHGSIPFPLFLFPFSHSSRQP